MKYGSLLLETMYQLLFTRIIKKGK